MKLGTYAIEQDYSQYVARASEIVFAVVGTATKGPINTPTLCTSISDFVNKFGNLHPDCLGLYAGQYFLNQANKLYYVRAASGAMSATVSIKGKATNATVEDAIVLEFKTPGTYYNDYTVNVTKQTTLDELGLRFTLVVKNSKGIVVETISDILLSSLTKVESGVTVIVEDSIESNYVHLKSVSSTSFNTLIDTEEVEGVKKFVDYKSSGGDDGILNITSGDYLEAGKLLADENIDMNLFAIPGCSDHDVITNMLDLAEARGDSLYLVDPPNHKDATEIADWHNGIGGTTTHERFNSSYGALYWAWQKIYDSVNKVQIEVPPSVVVAPVIAKSTQMSEIWYAPAGLQRGIVYGVVDPVTAPDRNARDVLYTGENNVNCIVTDPQVGICVFGQKTLYRQSTALDRVNVRMLLNYLKRVIVAACRSLTFEPNDRITWNIFEDRIEPTLRNIQNHRGIYEYKIVKGETIVTDDDIDNYRMPCMILIRPTKAAEEIPIYFTLTSTGADFNSVLESNGIVVEN